MKPSLLFLLYMFTMSSYGRIVNPYVRLKFDKVIMCDFSGGKDWNQYIVDNKGQLASSITKTVALNKQVVADLNLRLGDKKSYGTGESACFTPHLGFVYYLGTKIVAYITVCLDCNVLVSSIQLDAQKQGKVGAGKDAYYMAGGPSKSFRLFLNDLLFKYNFSHQLRKYFKSYYI